MRGDILAVFKRTSLLVTSLLILLLPTAGGGNSGTVSASPLTDGMRRYLEGDAKIAINDFSKIGNGEILTKSLSAEDKREVNFCGIVSVNAPAQSSFEVFLENAYLLNKKSILESNSFSFPPRAADFENLTLDESDIEALKRCRVGNCGLRLSATMIERFQSEVDWNAADYPQKAVELFRRMLLQYVGDYLLRGEAALIEYRDKGKPFSLRQEQESLFKEFVWVSSHAPEFFEYLRNSQLSEPANVKKSIGWTKIKLGLEPAIIITETITYTADKPDGTAEILSVSKQIYASRYFDSSLGLTVLAQTPNGDNAPSTTLFYMSRSRTLVLSGVFGKLVRKIIEPEVVKKLDLLLRTTKSRAESIRELKDTPAGNEGNEHNTGWFNSQNYLIGILILVAVGLTTSWLKNKKRIKACSKPNSEKN